MKTYLCWLSPSPDYHETGVLHPNSTLLYYVSQFFSAARPARLELLSAEKIFLTEYQLEPLLRQDAQHWAEFKTGDDRNPLRYDGAYAERLLDLYKKTLAEKGELDFTIPQAGLKL